MTDQEILNNAPEGATNSQERPQGYFYYNWSYCEPRTDIRSLKDIRRIVELEKDRNVEYIPLDDRQLVYLTVDDLNRIKLEQQAKGLEDFAQSLMFRGCFENSFNKYDADEAAIELRSQAKALKEQVRL